jgi:uncharacterized OB-fold protein
VTDAPTYGDPLTAPFWEAAARREFVVQRCQTCGRHQFYPRPYCLACQSDGVVWVAAKGHGTVYSMTTVHLAVAPELTPPYIVAIVELDEGPRVMTNIVGGPCRIGDRVRVDWQERRGAPPLPVFRPVGEGVHGAT